MKALEKLNDAKSDPSSLDVKDLARTLTDGLAFLGTANVRMVQHRRSGLKVDLPKSMHPLCADNIIFSGANLFGNTLSSDIKEVSELNKISQSFRGSTRRFRGRGQWTPKSTRVFKPAAYFRRGRGRVAKRGRTSRSSFDRNQPLNQSRPSHQ